MKLPYAEPFKIKMVENIKKRLRMKEKNTLKRAIIIFSTLKVKWFTLTF